MEYIKGKPFFCLDTVKIKSYKYLDKNLECEILIIGGGIDGAIANFFLSKKYDVALVDKDRFGCGCTACATALLEYQLDDFASELKKYLTEKEIIDTYKMGLKSIEKIDDFVKKYGNYCYYAKRPTLLYSDKFFASIKIEEEYMFRKNNGFNCSLITPNNNPFPFKINRGIFCKYGGCELDPYLFTKQLIENSSNQNNLYENTKINSIKKENNKYIATTNYGEKIICKKIIIATGFNWELIGKEDLCPRDITYSIVTKPLKNFSWKDRTLIHDALVSYHYMRLLPNNSIIFGGEDTTFNKKFINSKLAEKKYSILLKQLKKLFPNMKSKIEINYKFCGCFATTKNNLGVIGKSEDENILYFISCGANGIINGMFGVELLDDILNNRPNKLENLFSPKREI